MMSKIYFALKLKTVFVIRFTTSIFSHSIDTSLLFFLSLSDKYCDAAVAVAVVVVVVRGAAIFALFD